MLGLSNTVGYAIDALGCIAFADGERVFARDIADCTGHPPAYLAKVLNSLTNQGLVESKRGYRGGFLLTQDASDVSLLDIVEAVEGPTWNEGCLLGMVESRPGRICPTDAFWRDTMDQIRSELAGRTLASIADSQHDSPLRIRCCTKRSRRPPVEEALASA